jgi:hypothetical protein
MRYVKGHFVLTGLDVPSMRFKSRPEARDLVQAAYPRLADQGERKGNVLRYAGARKARVCCAEPLADRARHVARRGIRDRSVYLLVLKSLEPLREEVRSAAASVDVRPQAPTRLRRAL